MLPPAFPAAPRDTGTGSDRPVPEREKGRGGRSPGTSGERPPTGGWVGGRSPTGTSSTSAGDVVQHRLPGAPDLLPVVASSSRLPSLRGAGGQVAPVRDPGTADVPVRVPEGAWSFPRRIRGRPGSASRVCASLEGPRAALEGQSAVGRGENGRAAKSVGGEGAPSGEARRPGGREACENSHDRAAVVDHPGKWATGRRARQCGGRRPAAGCRGRASCGQAREAPGSVRGVGPRGNGLRRGEPGDRARRAGGGDPLTGQDTGSPRALTSPFPAGNGRAGDGQPVATERSRRPPGLTPWTGTAPGATGRAPRGPADDAGPRGRSAAAGEDAAGWIVGVLGISRSTTGRSESGRRSAGSPVAAARPAGNQARYSPSTPAPQRASRRVSARSREGRRAAGAFATVPVWAAGVAARVAAWASPPRQARYSPSTPAPQRATRRVSARSGPGLGATAGTRAGAGAAAGSARTGRGRAGGACGTERSGLGRAVPRRR